MAAKISGCATLSAGTYDEITSSGMIKLAGEVKCTSLSASGSVNGDALVCSGDVKISGASSFSGEVRAKSISIAGAFRAKSNISCDEITAKGIIKIYEGEK